jgi:hypothetical protein
MVIILVVVVLVLLVEVIYTYPVHNDVGADVSIDGIRRDEARDV